MCCCVSRPWISVTVVWQVADGLSRPRLDRLLNVSFNLSFQMTAGLCVCVVLVVLCTSCLGLPFSSQPLDGGQRSRSRSLSLSAPSQGTTEVKPFINLPVPFDS